MVCTFGVKSLKNEKKRESSQCGIRADVHPDLPHVPRSSRRSHRIRWRPNGSSPLSEATLLDLSSFSFSLFLIAAASNLIAMASNLIAMASNLIAAASNLINSDGL